MATTSTTLASDTYAAINAANAGKSGSSASASADNIQSQFMTLLTTQLKNQDPLNPMDNAQMTSQLAQISTVQGIDKLNSTLSKLIDSQSQTQTLQSAALVGRGVLVAGSNLNLQSGAAVGGFELAGPADKLSIDIKDANGVVVRTLTDSGLEAGVYPFAWDGKTNSGEAAADGQYSFSVTATQGSNDVTVNKLQYGLVNSVAVSGSGISANLGALGLVSWSEIKQIL
ncbi:MAG: flagellar hook assembly protein FlgD [Rhodocyclaceae bacterium]|nr:flagellar hook assembly protein FlgD [Rhodocyclaceae bacterium]